VARAPDLPASFAAVAHSLPAPTRAARPRRRSTIFDGPEAPNGRILLVEDDLLQAEALALILRQEGYLVEVAASGEQGLAAARAWPGPDLVLLDLALPDLSGVEVARRLRATSTIPILVLTGRRQESDKIVGLDSGADDYVTKPFAPGELLARIRALLRRAARADHGPEPWPGVVEVGPLRIDPGTRRVTRDGAPIDLSAREFAILYLLADAGGRVVERRRLFERVWGSTYFGDDRALDVYVRMIRKKIEPDPQRPRFLHTVRGVGYRLGEEDPPPPSDGAA
jgi:DNA-binding response OmpR family regulator